MGDLTVALEPPGHLRLASDDSLQSGEYNPTGAHGIFVK